MVVSDPTANGYPKKTQFEPGSQDLIKFISAWLSRAQAAFSTRNIQALVDLFDEEGYWRDILTLDFDINSLKKAEIKSYIEGISLDLPPLQNLILDRPETVQGVTLHPGTELVQGYIKFETETYRGSGLLQLKLPADSDLSYHEEDSKAMLFFTQLWEVKGHEERVGSRRPVGTSNSYEKFSPNWLEMRADEIESYGVSIQPTVLIIGAGQNGLMLAARLKLLGVSALVVDKSKQVGDCWRRRYHSLCLHDPISANHFPYMPYPDSWPRYIPKDKLAGWFQYYAEAMELSIWLQSTLKKGSASYDPASGSWSVDVLRPSGSRTLRPRYLVMATGLSGEPRRPCNFRMDAFTGTLLHSSQFESGASWKGKRAVVIGACNSAHDIAADLWAHGAASVTMVQRSSTYVMSSQHGLPVLLKGSYEQGPSLADADLGFTALPLRVLEQIHCRGTIEIAERDRSLLESLAGVGFKLDPYPGGLLMKFFRRGGGYYIDVGCSKLIVKREIRLKQGVEVAELTSNGVRFADGEEIDAELVVCATGYGPLHDSIRSIVGVQVAEALGPIWGEDAQGEIPGVWRLSGHPAFWIVCGNFALSRCYSKHVANQILLQELGLYDKNFPGRLNKTAKI